MVFVDYLERTRARPENERRRLLWIWTSLITLSIVSVWLVNLYVTGIWAPSYGPASGVSTSTVAQSGVELSQDLGSFQEGVRRGWEVIAESLTKGGAEIEIVNPAPINN